MNRGEEEVRGGQRRKKEGGAVMRTVGAEEASSVVAVKRCDELERIQLHVCAVVL